MEVRSLAYRTDLIFPRFDGRVIDRGDHLVVTTPGNPTFWWGNFVLFPHPPAPGDLARWKAVFAEEIGRPERVGHAAFGFDGTDGEPGEVQPFLDDGFVLEESVVLTAREVREPPRYNPLVEVRPLSQDWEWEAAVANQVLYRPEGLRPEGFRQFKERQMRRYRAMSDAGRGNWFGAFLGGRLVADLGVFHDGEVARYQSVGTHPDFRRQGICGTLVYRAAEHAFRWYGVRTLVMVADEHYHAARIYQSVGFAPAEKSAGLVWWDSGRH